MKYLMALLTQFTPGSVLSTATFVGYQINGTWEHLPQLPVFFCHLSFFVLMLNPIVPYNLEN